MMDLVDPSALAFAGGGRYVVPVVVPPKIARSLLLRSLMTVPSGMTSEVSVG